MVVDEDGDEPGIPGHVVEAYVNNHLGLEKLPSRNLCGANLDCVLQKVFVHKCYRREAHWLRFLLYEFLYLQREQADFEVKRIQFKIKYMGRDRDLRWFGHCDLLRPSIGTFGLHVVELWVEDGKDRCKVELALCVVACNRACVVPFTDDAPELLRCLEGAANGVSWALGLVDAAVQLRWAPQPSIMFDVLKYIHIAMATHSPDVWCQSLLTALSHPLETEHGSALYELHLVDAALVSGPREVIVGEQFECFLGWTIRTTHGEWTELGAAIAA